jgi:hypothetical protein
MYFKSLFGLLDMFHIHLPCERYWIFLKVCMYPDDDRDSGWNVSEINNVINTIHMHSFTGFIL